MTARRYNLLVAVTLLGGVALAKYAASFQREWKISYSEVARMNTPSARVVGPDWWEGDEVIKDRCIFLALFIGVLEVFNITAFLKSRSKGMDEAWTIMKMGMAIYCHYQVMSVAKFWDHPICQSPGEELFHPPFAFSSLQRCADKIQAQYLLGYVSAALNLFAFGAFAILSADTVRLRLQM